jgi:cell division septation protein DedD
MMSELGTGQAREDMRRQLLDDDGVQDTEITLSTGKLLGIFFALVIVCSVFFTMGYLLGRSTANGSRTDIVGTVTTGGSAAGKPSAANKVPDTPPPAPSPDAQAASSSAGSASSGQPASSSAPTEIKASPNGTYTVQVAAVSKKEDADILVSALLKKQYPAFSASSASDALFHVQVGPFVDPKDAETMRSRLAGDGYNAIVKH